MFSSSSGTGLGSFFVRALERGAAGLRVEAAGVRPPLPRFSGVVAFAAGSSSTSDSSFAPFLKPLVKSRTALRLVLPALADAFVTFLVMFHFLNIRTYCAVLYTCQ
jgi:hypothetical protein